MKQWQSSLISISSAIAIVLGGLVVGITVRTQLIPLFVGSDEKSGGEETKRNSEAKRSGDETKRSSEEKSVECNSKYVIVSTPNGEPLNAHNSNSEDKNVVSIFPNHTIFQYLGSDRTGKWIKVKAAPSSQASGQALVGWVWSKYIDCLSNKTLNLSRNRRITKVRESAKNIFQQAGGDCLPAASTLIVNCDNAWFGSWRLDPECINGSFYDANGNGMKRSCNGKLFYKFYPDS